MNDANFDYEDVASFFKNKKLSFFERTEFFHATNGISSATDVFQDIETKELFEISWFKEFENQNLVKKYLPIKKTQYDYQV
jgi:hypothetical protein